jgi:ABC-type nitrate/sulfonate/bicarbonate transport system permease component
MTSKLSATSEPMSQGYEPSDGVVGEPDTASPRAPIAAEATRENRILRFLGWARGHAVSIGSVAGGLALWQLAGALDLVDPLFLPSLADTATRLWNDQATGGLGRDIIASAVPFVIGLVISVILGCAIGVLMGISSVSDRLFSPWVLGFNAVPRIAFIPICILIFGLTVQGKVAQVVLMGTFPMILNMRSGVRSVDAELVEMGRSFHASRLLTLRRIILPATLPFFIAGFRITIALSLIGVVVAEFFSSSAGIGYRLNIATQTFDITEVYAMVVLLAVAGIVLAQLVQVFERRIDRWQGGHGSK